MRDRPDDLFIGLEFNLTSKSLVRMFVGHYSEIRPDIDLLDRKQREQKYWKYGNVLIVAFQNCLNSYEDFKEFINRIENERLIIDLQAVFSIVYKVCKPYTDYQTYTYINANAVRVYPVHHDIFRRAKKVIFYLDELGKKFNIEVNPTINYHYVPIELGAFLQSVQHS